MCLQVNRKYYAVLDENRKLKEDQNTLLTSLKGREQRVKELEEKIVKVQENREEKSKEIVVTKQSNYIETSDKAIQTHSTDAAVSS